MSAEPDFINTWVHQLQDEPNTLVLYETCSWSRPRWPEELDRPLARTGMPYNLHGMIALHCATIPGDLECHC
jgi:hypothetical protein